MGSPAPGSEPGTDEAKTPSSGAPSGGSAEARADAAKPAKTAKKAKQKRARDPDAPRKPKKPNRRKRKQPPGWSKEDRPDGPDPRIPKRHSVEPAGPSSLLPSESDAEPEAVVASVPEPVPGANTESVTTGEAVPEPAAANPATEPTAANPATDEASSTAPPPERPPRGPSPRQRDQAMLAWIVVPKLEALLTELEEVLNDPEAARDTLVNARSRLVREWRALKPIPPSDADRLSAAYDESLGNVTRRIDATVDPRKEEEKTHIAMRETMIEAASGLVSQPNLKLAIKQAKALQREWRDAPRVARDVAKKQTERFRAAMDAVFARREHEEAERLVKLEAFVDSAEALSRSPDPEKAADAMKRLQAQWKETGGVRGEKGDAVWTRFRAAADAVFERRQESRAKMHAQNLEVRQALIDEANGLADEGVEDADAVIRDLQRRWRQTGHVPREAADTLWNNFKAALDRIRNPPAMDPTALGDGQEGLSFNPFAGIVEPSEDG